MTPSVLALLLVAAIGLHSGQPARVDGGARGAAIPAWDDVPEERALGPALFPRAPGQKGIWMGAIPLCRETVASATLVTRYGGPAVVLVLRETMWERLEQETRRYLERRMPIRIDGRAIAIPTVETPITGGSLEIHMGFAQEARRIAATARRPCPRGALSG